MFGTPACSRNARPLYWRRTLLSLVVVDLFIWRSWLTSEPTSAQLVPGLPGLDYQGVCALMAAAATIILACVVWIRSRQLHTGNAAVPASLLAVCTVAVVGLGGTAIAAIAVGG